MHWRVSKRRERTSDKQKEVILREKKVENSEDFWGEHRGSGKRAIVTKAAQVCFSSLLEFLPIFDFSVCLLLDI